jgi:hypothetical protein
MPDNGQAAKRDSLWVLDTDRTTTTGAVGLEVLCPHPQISFVGRPWRRTRAERRGNHD